MTTIGSCLRGRGRKLAGVLGYAALIVGAARAAFAADELRIEVRETAGIRRFGYPVSWRFTLPEAVPAGAGFRLYDGDRDVAAQFRPVASGESNREWFLNFNVNLMPFEAREYRIEYGDDVPAAPQPGRGMTIARTDGAVQVINAPYLTFTVPDDLRTLLQSVATPAHEFMDPDSTGLVLRVGDAVRRLGTTAAAGGARPVMTVIKEGPISNALRFVGSDRYGDSGDLNWTAHLEFVNSKSWVRVDWQLDDPKGAVTALGADLDLALDPADRQEPTLVDFGAGTLVYATLSDGESARLESAAGGGWQVLHGRTSSLEPFVASPRNHGGAPGPEGWAHVMDRRRSTAVAVAEFGQENHDWIEVSDRGRLQIRREFAEPGTTARPGTKRLTFWLHFVTFPPHVGAATSAQSMLAPLEVRALEAASK